MHAAINQCCFFCQNCVSRLCLMMERKRERERPSDRGEPGGGKEADGQTDGRKGEGLRGQDDVQLGLSSIRTIISQSVAPPRIYTRGEHFCARANHNREDETAAAAHSVLLVRAICASFRCAMLLITAQLCTCIITRIVITIIPLVDVVSIMYRTKKSLFDNQTINKMK